MQEKKTFTCISSQLMYFSFHKFKIRAILAFNDLSCTKSYLQCLVLTLSATDSLFDWGHIIVKKRLKNHAKQW